MESQKDCDDNSKTKCLDIIYITKKWKEKCGIWTHALMMGQFLAISLMLYQLSYYNFLFFVVEKMVFV